jgi:predicted metal-dependent HD superfamily phosphohydrolase
VRHLTSFIFAGRVADPGVVIAAAFFHDAIYDPTASDNEAASARLAADALAGLGWDLGRCAEVASMIEATARHDVEGVAHDAACLLAADLAVLAAEPARYGDYVRAVRREYAHVDDDAWRAGRSAVLRSLLDRGRIFAPDLDLDGWERRARANMTAELRALSS